jgi:carboxylesterase type B
VYPPVCLCLAGAYRTLGLHASKNTDSYWYSFDFQGKYSLFPIFFPSPPPPIPSGVAHSDDLLYIFHFFAHGTEEEKTVSKNMLNYWVNFAYNG